MAAGCLAGLTQAAHCRTWTRGRSSSRWRCFGGAQSPMAQMRMSSRATSLQVRLVQAECCWLLSSSSAASLYSTQLFGIQHEDPCATASTAGFSHVPQPGETLHQFSWILSIVDRIFSMLQIGISGPCHICHHSVLPVAFVTDNMDLLGMQDAQAIYDSKYARDTQRSA